MAEEATVRIIEAEEVISGVKWLAQVELSWSKEKVLVEFTDPSSVDDEKLITWFLEDYAISDPFNAGRATNARNILRQYGRQLYDTIFGIPVPSLQRMLVFVVSSAENSQFQKLHWELLEDHFRYSLVRLKLIAQRFGLPGYSDSRNCLSNPMFRIPTEKGPTDFGRMCASRYQRKSGSVVSYNHGISIQIYSTKRHAH